MNANRLAQFGAGDLPGWPEDTLRGVADTLYRLMEREVDRTADRGRDLNDNTMLGRRYDLVEQAHELLAKAAAMGRAEP